MQIVIDIPEELYKEQLGSNWMGNVIIHDAIINGTLLPKGHGRLIECERLQEVFRRNVVGYAGFKQLFDIAPTIIEADKESEE